MLGFHLEDQMLMAMPPRVIDTTVSPIYTNLVLVHDQYLLSESELLSGRFWEQTYILY